MGGFVVQDGDLELLYLWSHEELRNGNRLKASRIDKVYQKFRELRGNKSRTSGRMTYIDTFDTECVLKDMCAEIELNNN